MKSEKKFNEIENEILTFHKAIPNRHRKANPPTLPPITTPKSIGVDTNLNSLGTNVKIV